MAMNTSLDRGNGYIYLVGCDESFAVKIGWSRAPKSRMKTLQCGSPVELKMLFYVKAFQQNEQHVHRLFKKYKSHGEWFICNREIYEFFKNYPGVVAVDSGDYLSRLPAMTVFKTHEYPTHVRPLVANR